MRKVVSNTGPLLHLQEAQLLSLLEQVGQLYIPKAVDLEMVQYGQDWRDRKPSWIVAATVSAPHDTQAAQWQRVGLLHPGEAEAIALTRELGADWFLTDDGAA